MIDVRKLRMLVELDRLGTIAAVGHELRLTPPGISTQLATLERELSVVLTERQGRRLALTPAGRLLAEHGRDVLDRLALAELEVDALRRGTTGRYRLGVYPSAASTFVADVWRSLIDDGTAVELRVETREPDEAIASVVAGTADLAIVHAYTNLPRAMPDGLEVESLATEPVWLAIRADDPAASEVVDLAALANHPWIAPHSDMSCYEMTDRACGMAGFRPRIIAQSSEFAVQLEYVAATSGVALIPHLAALTVPSGVRLVRTESPLRRYSSAVYRTTLATDAGVAELVGRLRKAAAARLQDVT